MMVGRGVREKGVEMRLSRDSVFSVLLPSNLMYVGREDNTIVLQYSIYLSFNNSSSINPDNNPGSRALCGL